MSGAASASRHHNFDSGYVGGGHPRGGLRDAYCHTLDGRVRKQPTPQPVGESLDQNDVAACRNRLRFAHNHTIIERVHERRATHRADQQIDVDQQRLPAPAFMIMDADFRLNPPPPYNSVVVMVTTPPSGIVFAAVTSARGAGERLPRCCARDKRSSWAQRRPAPA